VQAAVSHGESLLLNARRFWVEASLEQKQRLQEVFFPRVLPYARGTGNHSFFLPYQPAESRCRQGPTSAEAYCRIFRHAPPHL